MCELLIEEGVNRVAEDGVARHLAFFFGRVGKESRSRPTRLRTASLLNCRRGAICCFHAGHTYLPSYSDSAARNRFRVEQRRVKDAREQHIRYTVGVFSRQDLLDAYMENPLGAYKENPTYIFIKGLSGEAAKAGVALNGNVYDVPADTGKFVRDKNDKDTRDFMDAYVNEIKYFARELGEQLFEYS